MQSRSVCTVAQRNGTEMNGTEEGRRGRHPVLAQEAPPTSVYACVMYDCSHWLLGGHLLPPHIVQHTRHTHTHTHPTACLPSCPLPAAPRMPPPHPPCLPCFCAGVEPATPSRGASEHTHTHTQSHAHTQSHTHTHRITVTHTVTHTHTRAPQARDHGPPDASPPPQ